MHPADLAEHRKARHQANVRLLERDLACLRAKVPAADYVAARSIVDAARSGQLPIAAAHDIVRRRMSQHDRTNQAA